MKRYYFLFSKVLIAAILCCFSAGAIAVPAKRTPFVVTQPDGSKVSLQKKGDENFHYTTTTDGFLVKQGVDGSYYYQTTAPNGDIVLSSTKANDAQKRSAAEVKFLETVQKEQLVSQLASKAKTKGGKYRIKSASNVKTKATMAGATKGIAILVEYKDVKFTDRTTVVDRFRNMLNAVGYSDNGATGSARDYFIENSSGKFASDFDVYGIVTLSQNMAYYGANDPAPDGEDVAPEKMVIEACQALESSVDFAQYDNDGDGFIDNVYIFYAGYGEATSQIENTVWPHAWGVLNGAGVNVKIDGKQLDSYACSNELEVDNTMTGIGTFTHEFCHVLGLPDLYDTSGGSAFTPGAWSILDYGPYNNDGRTPPNMSAYERYALGWLEPIELTAAANISVQSIKNNVGYIIKTPKTDEYFILENRQIEGWDAYLPGHGMLIWHIDYNKSQWDANTVNNTVSHQYVDIEEADGKATDTTVPGDAFPGTSNKTEFTDTSKPSMKTWAGVSLNKPITEITETGGLITFKFMGGEELIKTPVATQASDVTSNSFTANWNTVADATEYILDVYTLEGIEMRSVLSEDFAGFAAGTPNGTPNSTDVSASLDDYTQAKGWTGTKVYQAGGAVKMGSSSAAGSIVSPTIDLSQSGGAFNLSFDAMAWSGDATQLKIYVDNVLAHTLTGLPNGAGYSFAPFSVDLTGGTAASKIKFESNVAAKGRFFLDNLTINQGGASKSAILGSPFTEATTSKSLTGLTSKTLYYTVKAKAGELVSASSNAITVELTGTGIDLINADNGLVFVKDGKLNVKSNDSLSNKVQIYDINGKLIISETFVGETSFNTNEFLSGVYLVKIGHQTFKVVL